MENNREDMGQKSSRDKKFNYFLRRSNISKSSENIKTEGKMRRSKSSSSLAFIRNSFSMGKRAPVRTNTFTVKKDEDRVPIENLNNPSNIRQQASPAKETPESENHDRKKTDNNENHNGPENANHSTLEVIPHNNEAQPESPSLLALQHIDARTKGIEDRIEELTYEELFVYHATFKDELHNYWIKAYEIKDLSLKQKRIESIEYIKSILQKLNNKTFKGRALIKSDQSYA